MDWYLIHTKSRQENRALQNLEQQGYKCYLPTLRAERLRQGILEVTDEALFPRYLFIHLGQDESAKSWTPIRSTAGVSRLVSFGKEPAKVAESLIYLLQAQETTLLVEPKRLYKTGERVRLTEGAFAGLEGIYQMTDGEHRAMVLIELLSKSVTLLAPATSLRKVN
tara:strand:- start:381290 stop:381787 length:498 start_codon:yes stop_codon:yes gene_type:complete